MDYHDILTTLPYEERLLCWEQDDADKMETAMVLWEAFIDEERQEMQVPSWSRPVTTYRERVGVCAARTELASMVPAIHIGWCIAHRNGRGFDAPFDWEFAPWFMRECLVFEASGWIDLQTDWLDRCRQKGA
jgi:hypothetical protein